MCPLAGGGGTWAPLISGEVAVQKKQAPQPDKTSTSHLLDKMENGKGALLRGEASVVSVRLFTSLPALSSWLSA